MISQLFLLTVLLDNGSSLPDLFNLADTCTADNIGEGCGFEGNVGECCDDGGTYKCISVSVCLDEWWTTFDNESCSCKTEWYVTFVMITIIALLVCLVLWCCACHTMCLCKSSVRSKLMTTIGLWSEYSEGGIMSAVEADSAVELDVMQIDMTAVGVSDDDGEDKFENAKSLSPRTMENMIQGYKSKLTEVEKAGDDKMFIWTPGEGKKSFLISGEDMIMTKKGDVVDPALMAAGSKTRSRAAKIAQAKKKMRK